MWSILYIKDGSIYQIGPVRSRTEAILAAGDASEEGEFNILEDNVYLLHPHHAMEELTLQDFRDR